MDYTVSLIIGAILTAGVAALYVRQIIRHKDAAMK